MKKMLRYKYHVLSLLLLLSGHAFGQVTISGLTCVAPGAVYQYVITGVSDSLTPMQMNVNGGLIKVPSTGKMRGESGFHYGQVLVTWNDSSGHEGHLSLTSLADNAGLNVHLASLLHPGTIDSAARTQLIGYDSIPPSLITCAPDSGGSCSPLYTYQWQQSADRVAWKDIPAATEKTLRISSPMKESVFYRRKVREMNSGTIGYSDEAAVFVMVK